MRKIVKLMIMTPKIIMTMTMTAVMMVRVSCQLMRMIKRTQRLTTIVTKNLNHKVPHIMMIQPLTLMIMKSSK